MNTIEGAANLGNYAAQLAGDAVIGGDNSIAGAAARIPSLTALMPPGDNRGQ